MNVFFRIQCTSTRSIRVNFCDPQVRVAKLDRALPTRLLLQRLGCPWNREPGLCFAPWSSLLIRLDQGQLQNKSPGAKWGYLSVDIRSGRWVKPAGAAAG